MATTHTFHPSLIVALRQDLGWSQQVFASFFKVSFRTVQNWELGTATPNDFQVAAMHQLRYRLDQARQQKQQEQFKSSLQEKLPAILFGIGVGALLHFLYTESEESTPPKKTTRRKR